MRYYYALLIIRNTVRNIFSIFLQSVQLASKVVQLASKEMDSSAEDSVLHRRETNRESCLRLEFSIYARPSKVLTTERLVFFRGDYEIESGQGNDTASVSRGRQTERPAVESPHGRDARLFSDD